MRVQLFVFAVQMHVSEKCRIMVMDSHKRRGFSIFYEVLKILLQVGKQMNLQLNCLPASIPLFSFSLILSCDLSH